jgi:hypothetical protein
MVIPRICWDRIPRITENCQFLVSGIAPASSHWCSMLGLFTGHLALLDPTSAGSRLSVSH